MSDRYPHSIPGWITYLKEHGVSDRAFPENDSDLINPATYADPLDAKPERAALASIIAIRAYQRARRNILSQADILSQPAIDVIEHQGLPYSEQVQAFLEKSWKIGMAFDTGMEDALGADEQFILAHRDHPAAGVYFRLKSIVDPHIPENERRSSVFHNVYSGVGALPGTMEPLIGHVRRTYFKKHKESPSLKKLAQLMSGSFDKYVQPLASLHKADAEVLLKLMRSAAEQGYIHRFVQLVDGGVQFDPKRYKAIRRIDNTSGKPRSRTTRCAFLTSAKSVEMFLDEPPDFDDPLQDAFQLYMKLLSA